MSAIQTTREQRRQLARENARLPLRLTEIPRDQWPVASRDSALQRVYRSRNFLVQIFDAEPPAIARLSINRTTVDAASGRWQEGISWDELQAIKNELGYQRHTAVEIYPPAADVVNVANIRHLFVLDAPFPFQWTARGCSRASADL